MNGSFAINLDLSSKSALICGGSAGIGLACARAMAAHNCQVTLVSRDEGRLNEALTTLPKAAGVVHRVLAADLSNPDGLQERIGSEIDQHGPYHIVLHNTGGPPAGPMLDATTQQLTTAFASLVLAAHAVTRAVVPGMKKANYGRIMMISSTSVKQPIPNLGLSNAVRAAVSNWGKSLSQELGGFGITVNSILPGFVDTPRLSTLFSGKATKLGKTVDQIREEAIAEIPAGRIGLPEEIAGLAVFLASSAGAYINGAQIPVDGGRLKSL